MKRSQRIILPFSQGGILGPVNWKNPIERGSVSISGALGMGSLRQLHRNVFENQRLSVCVTGQSDCTGIPPALPPPPTCPGWGLRCAGGGAEEEVGFLLINLSHQRQFGH